jgi:hypothetical protein
MKRSRILRLGILLGGMLFALHAYAALPSGAIASVACAGEYTFNGQTGLTTDIVIRNLGGTIKVLDVRMYNESGALLKSYTPSNPPPGVSMTLSGLKMTAFSGQAIFGNATIGRLTTVIRYQNVTSPAASISEALVIATEIGFAQGSIVSRSSLVCQGV